MADYNEKPFETEICEHLAANGWFYSTHSKGYDRERALFPEDVFGWLSDTQPDSLAKVVKAGSPDESKQRSYLLDRLVKVLDTPVTNGGGTLNVLRNGFKQVSAKFEMAQFKPETTLNATDVDRYAKMRVRVVRQVYFSTADKRSVDLALFVNGLPVATLELKTDFTQSVNEAIAQYKTRLPRDPGGGEQPLFASGRRALVHFAVSNDEVWMTTKLDGPKTRFLPFNVGFDGGAGNPPAADGKSSSAYLWGRVLHRDSLLDILGKFMHTETTTSYDPITGKPSTRTALLFPRYHQWDAVTSLASAARIEGPGHRYLVQHSAGSGKTNSIAWAAHRLARLHDANNKKVFDSVIVVTDRNVLDAQLQDAIRQIDGGTGVVVAIDEDAVSKAASTSKGDITSKSGLLAKSLLDGRLIIVVTIQTFPYAMDTISKTKGLAHKKFAVIADEAHSSQTGSTANRLKEVLSAEELASLADGGEIDTEAVLAAEATARASSEHISYFAFTATPKAKTLELFGRKPGGTHGEDALPAPFHVYTMKQAIEEKYILDVLPGYQTYKTAFQIAVNATNGKVTAAGNGQEPQPDTDLVDESSAVKGLMKWVKLHPTNISQKVRIIVEHFRSNVEDLLEGHAKAMVVTDSRKAAVRYKIAIDKYIADHGYAMKTLVAFSGEVEDIGSGPDKFTESNMNPGLGGQDLRSAFAGDDYKVMLVANKFQTGFDQPLLCAMYVDKQLSGVTAVQTLSRLNRVYTTPNGVDKTQPFILDFVNDPEEVRKAFEPYYTDAFLETATDPNLVHDLSAKLDQAQIFTDDEVDAVVDIWVKGGKGAHNALTAGMAPAKQRFKTAYMSALTANGGSGDKAAVDVLDMFRKDVATFVRLYDFMSQIVDYADVELEKRSIFLRLLERLIRDTNWSSAIDLGDVTLLNVKQVDTGKHNLSLGDKKGLTGLTAAGSGTKTEPTMVAFAEVIDRLNDQFGDEEFSAGQKTSFVEMALNMMLENEVLFTQAAANTSTQFAESPDIKPELLTSVADGSGAQQKITDFFFSDSPNADKVIVSLAALYHATVQERVGEGVGHGR
ncbi:DEAD/DEAH box helicase family protein [Rhodococcus antarcticus]|uniref:DEAD/DEAH box helicase family protein n=1 Tax=Rhodococcus antarcticus TaxID=2987751 RepID=A0ABY6NZI2_9NOCA|nr:type I restriction endonuclease [Rhodococcus antarcticus]UZJ24516.1 DEAD/DEAH box helicase family protein [Rhodococcus antarcticus]